jgi:hypothetical protein
MKQKSGPDKAPADQVLKDIRRQTRRQYSAEEKIRIVLEGLRGEENTRAAVLIGPDAFPGSSRRSRNYACDRCCSMARGSCLGLANFHLLHSKKNDADMSLCGFDLIELNGDDFRRFPLLDRKTQLQKILAKTKDAIHYNEHIEGEGPVVFEHACKLGCEGIVAKRKDLPYESGRSKRWLKIKNPDRPAMQRIRDRSF